MTASTGAHIAQSKQLLLQNQHGRRQKQRLSLRRIQATKHKQQQQQQQQQQ
jgi:hypothetical protein